MKLPIILVLLALLPACAHKSSSREARQKLESKWEDQIGQAMKSEIVEDFGDPEWCHRNDSGIESCRFSRKKGTKWIGEGKTDKKHYTQFDEISVEFETNGILKSFKANAQR